MLKQLPNVLTLLLACLGLCLIPPACSKKKQIPESAPNIIILLIDSLRADALKDYGNIRNTNPFLAEFGKKGIRFTQAYSHSSHTKISVASLFTGLLPPVHNVRRAVFPSPGNESDLRSDSLSSRWVTLAEVLKKKGYRTAAFVTNPHIQAKFGFSQGFIDYKTYPWTKTNARMINRKTLTWIKKKPQASFFIYMHYMDVHHPYRPPGKYRFLYTEKKKLGIIQQNGLWKQPISQEQIQYTRAIYEAQINYWDDCFREFMENMEKNGWLKNTLFFVLGDHGEEFYDHGGFGHGITLYEEEIKVPLYAVWENKIPPDQQRNDPVQLIDIFPTICSLVNRNISNLQLPGLNLLDPKNMKQILSRAIYSETFKGKIPRSVKTKEFKLIYNSRDKDFEFYNLKKDPQELKNLYEQDNPIIESLKITLLQTSEMAKAGAETKKLDPETIKK